MVYIQCTMYIAIVIRHDANMMQMSDLHAHMLVPVDTAITSTAQRLPNNLLCAVVWTVEVARIVYQQKLAYRTGRPHGGMLCPHYP